MKTLMIALLTLSALSSQAFAASKNTASCRIITGYGQSVGYGADHKEALENARLLCGDKMIEQRMAQRGQISDDVIEDLSTACVNLKCQ